MNWEAIGAIGEIVGALAVLATLYYLAIQIKMQNYQLQKSNEQARVSLSLELNDSYTQLFDMLLRDKDFISIYHRGIENESLDKIETEQFSQHINKCMALVDSAVVAAKAELHFDGDYELEFMYGNKYLHELLNTSIGSTWFKETAPLLYSEDFLQKISEFKSGHSLGQTGGKIL